MEKVIVILKDVSSWLYDGVGGNGTLEMEILLSPVSSSRYYMKYAYLSEQPRTHLEDVNEVVAAKIAKLLKLNVIEVGLAIRNCKRGCLSLCFLEQTGAHQGEPGKVLLCEEFKEQYEYLLHQNNGNFLIDNGFNLLERFSYFDKIRKSFIKMNLFDILIGNKDRHAENWTILFKNNNICLAHLYDNGASLGFQLPDEKLERDFGDENDFDKYYYHMKVKGGLLDKSKMPAHKVLSYIVSNYREVSLSFKRSLLEFPFDIFEHFINEFPIYSQKRKDFIKCFIRHRSEIILNAIRKGVT